MKFKSLEELLVKELQDLFDAENQLLEALPKVQSAVSTPELKDAIKKHLGETREQVNRLETCLNSLQADKRGETCEAMRGLIEECDEFINAQAPSILKDSAIIGAAQKIEHYEIAAYGTAKAHAKMLDLDDIVDLLDDTLKEESNADKKLTKIAEGTIFTAGLNKLASSK